MTTKITYSKSLLLSLPTFLLTLVTYYGTAQQANVNLDYNPQKNTEGLNPFSAPLNSPEVHDDQTVTFRLRAPKAQEVKLAGVALLTGIGKGNEQVPFTKGEDGIWTLTVGPLKPDMYAYHFNVDRSEEHTSELQSRENLVCRLLLEKK